MIYLLGLSGGTETLKYNLQFAMLSSRLVCCTNASVYVEGHRVILSTCRTSVIMLSTENIKTVVKHLGFLLLRLTSYSQVTEIATH